jgi:hypothetical protein
MLEKLRRKPLIVKLGWAWLTIALVWAAIPVDALRGMSGTTKNVLVLVLASPGIVILVLQYHLENRTLLAWAGDPKYVPVRNTGGTFGHYALVRLISLYIIGWMFILVGLLCMSWLSWMIGYIDFGILLLTGSFLLMGATQYRKFYERQAKLYIENHSSQLGQK